MYFGELLPFVLMIAFNIVIIYKANRYGRTHRRMSTFHSPGSSRASKRKAQMTRMILFITFLYILVTIPSTILSGYFYTKVVVLPQGQFIVNLVNGVQFSYPAFNFFILYCSNKLFAREVRLFLFTNGNGNSAKSFQTSVRSLHESHKSVRFSL